MIIPNAKEYEKPESGVYHGVLADIVDLGQVTTSFQGQTKTQPMVRFVWILNVLGKDAVKFPSTYGKPLTVAQRFNVSSLHEKSNVYKTLKMILGTPPPPGFDIENLIGQTRQLLINREKSPDGAKDFANVMGILPAQPGVAVPVPADFVRAKFRTQQTAGPQGQPVQTYAQPPQQFVPATAAQPQAQQFSQASTAQQYQVPQVPQGADVKF